MIPLFARIRVVREAGWGLRLWVPLFIVWLIALPFALLALPFLLIACWAQRLKAWRTIGGVWQVFAGLRGTEVQASNGRDAFLVRIY